MSLLQSPMIFSIAMNGTVGAALIFGGMMGYVKARSFASLMAGGVSGAALLISCKLMASGNQDGLIASTVVCTALAAMMGNRYRISQAKMPGMIAAATIMTIVVNALTYFIKMA